MYSVVVQDSNFIVRRVIQCETMAQVQEVLESLEPSMDSGYLTSGDASSLTWGDFTYSFRKLENANELLPN